MTPTAKELWNDPVFLEKRIKEQTEYMREIMDRIVTVELSEERKDDQRKYFLSASNLQMQFMERLWAIGLV